MSGRYVPGRLALLFLVACLLAACGAPRPAPDALAADEAAARHANADRWNATFEMRPGAAYGWSGGDAAISLALPYCRACPAGSRHRRLWLFGDSAFSTVDAEGYRRKADGTRGADYAFGNVAAITTHAAAAAPAALDLSFDYGATGFRSASWMPLLLDPRRLPGMDELRIAAAGYADLGFARTPQAVAGVYTLPTLAPEPQRADLIAVHEYYEPGSGATDYRGGDSPSPGSGWTHRRIAFHVHRSPQPGTVALYRHVPAAQGGVVLDTSAGGAHGAGELLGYVYPRAVAAENVHALVEYARAAPGRGEVQRVYTTRPNDHGKEILMWPNRGLLIGKDLVQVFSPVAPLQLPGMVPWEDIGTNVVSIIRGVDRPYAQWGKALHGDWVSPPEQFALDHTDAHTNWGHFLLADADFARNGHVYVYGVRERKLVVARVACRTAEDFVRFGNWRFYRDGEWVAGQENAAPIADYAATDFSILRSPAGRYVLLQSPPGMVPAIATAIADAPTGPFRPGARIELSAYRNESDRHGRYAYYAASAHAGLSAGGRDGGLLVSYIRSCAFSVDGACTGEGSDENRADVYVPRFIDLPWRVLDP